MNFKLKIPQQLICWILFIAISVMLIANVYFIHIDNSIAGTDSSNHLFASLEFYYHLKDIFIKGTYSLSQKFMAIYHLISRPGSYGGVYWPNGLNASTTIFYYIFQPSLFSAKLSLLPYILILLGATFYIGKHYGTTFNGLIAAYILFSYPIVFESSRQYQLDFPLTAMVALTIALLLRSRHFKDRLYSCLAGCSFGCAMLIKGQAIIFIIIPLAIVLIRVFYELRINKQEKKGVQYTLKNNIALFFLFFSIFMSFWWFGKTGQVKQQLFEHIFVAQKASYDGFTYVFKNKFSLKVLFFYIRAAIWSMGPLALGVFVLLAFWAKEKVYSKPICFFWSLSAFVVFSTVLTLKSPRFLMPILPAIALITSWQISSLRKNKGVMVYIILLVGLLQFYSFSYAGVGKAEIVKKTYNYLPPSGYTVKPQMLKRNIVEVAEALKAIKQEIGVLKVGTICAGDLDSFEVLYWLLLYEKNLDIVDLVQAPSRFAVEFESMDVVLFSSHSLYQYNLEWPQGEELWELLLRRFPTRTEVQRPENLALWKFLGIKLEQAKTSFVLFGKVRDKQTGYNLYYVYKKVTDNICQK